MAVSLNVLLIEHVCSPLQGIQRLKGLSHCLLMMVKLAGPPLCFEDAGKV